MPDLPFDGVLFARGPVVVLRWRLEDGWPVVFATDNAAGLFDRDMADFWKGAIALAEIVLPEDFGRLEAGVARCCEEGDGDCPHCDYRIRLGDGAVKWLRQYTALERDAEGVARTAVGMIIDITDLNHATEALNAAKTEAEAAKAMLQDALESTTEAFALFDADGRLTVFNEAYRRLYRHSKDLLRPGIRFEEMLRERAARGLVPDTGDDVEGWIRWRMEIFDSCEHTIERIFPDGTWWKMNEQKTSTGGTAQVLTDITEIKERETRLRESEACFRNLFQHTSVGAAIIGLDGGFRSVNEALCRMLGYSELELTGMSLLNLAFPEDQADFIRALGAYNAGDADSWPLQRRLRRRDGEAIQTHVSATLVHDAKGRPAYVVAHIEDIGTEDTGPRP